MYKLLAALNQRFFYHDRCYVKRPQVVLKANGSRRHVYVDVPSLQGVPCFFSNNSHSSSYPNRALAEREHGYLVTVQKRIFCDTGYRIQAGDKVRVVTRTGYQRQFVAGEAMQYENHQELLLQDVAEA